MFQNLRQSLPQALRRHVPVAVTAAVICSLFAGGPSVARAAFDAVNADKVDGKHAVGSGAGINARKGKLVATNGNTGRLPNDIIKKAQDANLLDGRDSTAYRATGHGKAGGFTNINGCGSGEVLSYAVTLSRPARLFATASSTYGRSNPGPERPTLRIQLLDATNTVVARTPRDGADATTGNPTMNVAGVLLRPDGSAPYDAAPGSYTLRIWGDNFGACAGFGQYQSPELTHIELAAGD
jgi:hypothetical protein